MAFCGLAPNGTAPKPGVSRSSAATYRRATSRAAISAAAKPAGLVVRPAVVTLAGAIPAACAVPQRSTPAAERRRVITATVDRRAWGRQGLRATSAGAPAEAAAVAAAEADVVAAVVDDLHQPTLDERNGEFDDSSE